MLLYSRSNSWERPNPAVQDLARYLRGSGPLSTSITRKAGDYVRPEAGSNRIDQSTVELDAQLVLVYTVDSEEK